MKEMAFLSIMILYVRFYEKSESTTDLFLVIKYFLQILGLL